MSSAITFPFASSLSDAEGATAGGVGLSWARGGLIFENFTFFDFLVNFWAQGVWAHKVWVWARVLWALWSWAQGVRALWEVTGAVWAHFNTSEKVMRFVYPSVGNAPLPLGGTVGPDFFLQSEP